MDTDINEKLLWAALIGKTENFSTLLTKPGINVNYADEIGNETALTLAASRGHIQIVSMLLLVPGIDVNYANNKGNTALMAAAKRGCTQTVSILLATAGIDRNHSNLLGCTALNMAVNSFQPSALHFLSAKTFQQISFIIENTVHTDSLHILATACRDQVLDYQKKIFSLFWDLRKIPALSDRHGPINTVLSFLYDRGDCYRHREHDRYVTHEDGTQKLELGDRSLMFRKMNAILNNRKVQSTLALIAPAASAREKPEAPNQRASKRAKG